MSIHELSKIRNLNEFPLPIKGVKLPDIPLPSAKSIFKVIARTPNNNNGKGKASKSPYESVEGGYTPASTPMITDDEMLRYDASTPGGDLPREQDFGYEVIDGSKSHPGDAGNADSNLQGSGVAATASAHEEDTLADQYRGTPPLKSKKNKKRPQSHELSEQSVS